MRLLKKLGGVDLYKQVEETRDAVYLDPGRGNKSPFLHFRSTNTNGMSWIKHFPETITRLAGGGCGTLRIKTSRGMPRSG